MRNGGETRPELASEPKPNGLSLQCCGPWSCRGGLGIHGPKPYKFIGFGDILRPVLGPTISVDVPVRAATLPLLPTRLSYRCLRSKSRRTLYLLSRCLETKMYICALGFWLKFRPKLTPRPLPTGPAWKMMQNANKIRLGAQV